MTKNGVNVRVIVDDKIPCKNKEPVFSENHGDEVWVVILEKAWAKLHGDYF
jgi:calpain-15